MNLVGHLEVAARHEASLGERLGVLLPDLASMLRTRIEHASLPADVRRGVALHHATDATFHSHAAVRRAMATLSSSAAARGVARGTARAIGHVGYELLLDAAAEPDRLRATLVAADDALVQRCLADAHRWPELRAHFAARASRHDDPWWVAERLFAVLRHRPRLRLPAEQVPRVAEVLAEQAEEVWRSAPVVFDDVTAAVTPAAPRFW